MKAQWILTSKGYLLTQLMQYVWSVVLKTEFSGDKITHRDQKR